MANYNIVVDRNFLPFDYSSRLAPIFESYAKDYNTAYDKYEERQTELAKLKYIIDSIDEENISAIYNNYETNLNNFGDSFLNGYSSSTKKDFMNLQKTFNENILPIIELKAKRDKLIELLFEYRMNDDSLYFDKDFSNISISDMIKDPDMTYSAISGRLVALKTSALVSELAKQINSLSFEGLGNTEKLYITYLKSKGYTYDDILSAINRNTNAPEELLNLINSIKEEYNYSNLNSSQQEHIDKYINEGLLSGVEQTESQLLNNPEYNSELDRYNAETARMQAETSRLKEERLSKEQEEQNPNSRTSKSTKKDLPTMKKSNDEWTITNPNTGDIFITKDEDEAHVIALKQGINVDAKYYIHPEASDLIGARIYNYNNAKDPYVYTTFGSNETTPNWLDKTQFKDSSLGYDEWLYDYHKLKEEGGLKNATVIKDINISKIAAILDDFVENMTDNVKNVIQKSSIKESFKSLKLKEFIKDAENNGRTVSEKDLNSFDSNFEFSLLEGSLDLYKSLLEYAIQTGLIALIKVPQTKGNHFDYVLLEMKK